MHKLKNNMGKGDVAGDEGWKTFLSNAGKYDNI